MNDGWLKLKWGGKRNARRRSEFVRPKSWCIVLVICFEKLNVIGATIILLISLITFAAVVLFWSRFAAILGSGAGGHLTEVRDFGYANGGNRQYKHQRHG